MPFNFRETIGGVNHLRLRWEKRLLSRADDFYLRSMKEPDSLKTLLTVVRSSDRQSNCAICGYAQARVEVAGGWLLETCSAVGLAPLLKSSKIKQWLLALPGVENSERPPELTSAGLPGQGV